MCSEYALFSSPATTCFRKCLLRDVSVCDSHIQRSGNHSHTDGHLSEVKTAPLEGANVPSALVEYSWSTWRQTDDTCCERFVVCIRDGTGWRSSPTYPVQCISGTPYPYPKYQSISVRHWISNWTGYPVISSHIH